MPSEKIQKIFYEGEKMSYSKAGAILLKKMIEEDLINLKIISADEDPHEWIGKKINKSIHTTRQWTYDWLSTSGASPPSRSVPLLLFFR